MIKMCPMHSANIKRTFFPMKGLCYCIYYDHNINPRISKLTFGSSRPMAGFTTILSITECGTVLYHVDNHWPEGSQSVQLGSLNQREGILYSLFKPSYETEIWLLTLTYYSSLQLRTNESNVNCNVPGII